LSYVVGTGFAMTLTPRSLGLLFKKHQHALTLNKAQFNKELESRFLRVMRLFPFVIKIVQLVSAGD
jgi:hypothetical protein